MKKVLILGAGPYQIPLIERALAAGLEVIVASWSMDDPGMSLGHDAWEVDTKDKNKLLELARKKGIDAVTTTGTDVAVPSIGHLCDQMGLPGISYETALSCTDKSIMQQKFAEADVPAAICRRARTSSDARAAAEAIGLPVVVKAPDSSGSRGVTVVNDFDQVPQAFDVAMEISRSGEVLVEECLVGEEFGAQSVVLNGEVTHCLCHNDTVTPPPITVPIGHSCPSGLSESVQEEAAEVCAAAVRALGIQNAVCNVDLTMTPKGVRMFEIGARIGATGIPEIIDLHYGLNLYDVALSLALGERPEIRLTAGPASAILLVRAHATGKLVRCRVPQEVADMQDVVAVNLDHAEGSPVREFRTGPDRIGDVLTVGDTADAAEALAERVVAALDIEVQPCD